jgi:hypothetical protein
MIPHKRRRLLVLLFAVLLILRGAQLAAQTPSSSTTTPATTTTSGSASVTTNVSVPFQVVAPTGCTVAFSSSGSIPVINVSGCPAPTNPTPPNPPNPPNPPAPGALAAFPGAMGGGAASIGGRGGAVMEVTTTNDSGTGSLRACVQASGPRTCVFRVAGVFNITGGDNLASSPFLTIACQTAPGEVIIGGPHSVGAALRISTHDVIVRYCVFSPDNAATASGPDTGTVGITIVNCSDITQNISLATPPPSTSGCYNIITDHVTTRWSGNKSWITTSNFTPTSSVAGVGPNHDITVQWHLDYEPHEGHPVGYGTATAESCISLASDGHCLVSFQTNVDYHHNLFANVSHRIPEIGDKSSRWVNNAVFNWGTYAYQALGAATEDVINSKFIRGNLNAGAQAHPIHFTANSRELCGPPSVYVAGNIFGSFGTTTVDPNQMGDLAIAIAGEDSTAENSVLTPDLQDNWCINPAGGNQPQTSGVAVPASWVRSAPMAASNAFPIVVDPVTNLDAILTGTAGANPVGASAHVDCNGNWVASQDPQDVRIIKQYLTGGSGGYWPNGVTTTGSSTIPTPTANWTDTPNVAGFTACTESLHDGIPDQWKKAQGLSTTDATVASQVAANGYTNLENYMNGVASSSTPPPPPPPPPTASASGTTVTTAGGGPIVDASGNSWTLNSTTLTDPTCPGSGHVCGTQIVLNGAAQGGTGATLLLYYNGVVYSENAIPLWWSWVGGNWVKAAGDPRPVTPPTPTITSSAKPAKGLSTTDTLAPSGYTRLETYLNAN